MTAKELNQLVAHIETHIECWKQFNHFLDVARTKKFSPPDENHFLEIKSIIVQELETIFAAVEIASPSREEIHALIGNAPSLRHVSELAEGAARGSGLGLAIVKRIVERHHGRITLGAGVDGQGLGVIVSFAGPIP